MMKKTYKSSLLALSVLASFTSCSESESLQQANLSKDKITFHATLDNSWKPMSPASSSRAAIAAATEKGPIVVSTPFGKPLYLHPVVQDGIHIWSKEGKPITRSGAPLEDVEHERVAQTRGTMSTKTDLNDYNSFGVTAIYKEGDTYQSLFANAEATKSAVDGFWGIEDKDKAQWPIDGIVSFHAYAPYNTKSSNMLTVTAEPEKVQSKIIYTASADDIINQPDLIVATSTGSRNNPGQDDAVNLQFSHALTAVSFAISKDLVEVIGAGNQLVSLSLEGVYTQGDCELAAKDAEHSTALLKWTGSSDKTGKYEFDLKDKNIIIDENLKDMALTEDNQTLMMIPQTLTADAKLKFEFKLNDVPQSVIIDMQGHEWLPGTSVIYKLSSSAINSLTNAEVIYPTTWNEAGYPKKAFAENEAIGLYAVSKDNKIVASNVKLVKQKNEKGEEIWKTTENKRFLYTANYRYFAYYPYDSTLKDEDVNAEAANADGFFAKKIKAWNPAKDQNSEDVLLNQDLQVASGVVEADASTLTFEMAHSMGLAVLNLKDKKVVERRTFRTTDFTYYFPELPDNLRATSAPDKSLYTDSETEPSQTVHASTNFKGHSPYKSKENLYMQIIKPSENVVFVAAEETGKPRSGWGALYPDRSTFSVTENGVVSKDIYSDADFYYLACYLTAKDKYEDNKVQKFVVTANGTYKLQCWGASGIGQQNNDWGGRGGYAEGDCTLDMSKILYVCVGGKGNQYNNPTTRYGKVGYYNGGGYGGGATSITTTLRYEGVRNGLKSETEKGQLAEYVNHKDEVLLVAGGGGGAEWSNQHGGAGGGDNGGTPKTGTTNNYTGAQCWCFGKGATQTAGGDAIGQDHACNGGEKAGFGYGGSAATNNDFGPTGGGGWYGGGGSPFAGVAGGGSSYGKTSDSPYSSTAPILTNYKTICGWSNISLYNESENKIPVPGGKSNEFEQKGHEGHGACVITQTSFN